MNIFNYLFPIILLSFACGMIIGVLTVFYYKQKVKRHEPAKSD